MLLLLRCARHLLLCSLTILIVCFVAYPSAVLAADAPIPLDSATAAPALPSRSVADPSSIPSEKVSEFVHACLQVVALIERREGELQGAETETESLRVEQEIEAEALAIIEKGGLTRQEYLQLLGLANTDPEFGERIAVQLQEATS
ncbi:DUF4168 domain-containing protein [Phormidium sp. FACHB-592]|uniref:DUF4168 domain-containing protein n=1 Tax=Stenomitos frigidus AS-A4 TaxID=2933935 RepID=A0ABV0KGF9_9CYAN|nr:MULTISPECIES: DUF4168 domain-containing protein [Cyanophyceae]MBD2035339.1 DUF4168 domain-containing protein [Leptolyngbya sp. FACHB-321]MBD2076722.1 DUF4168 domain-containing protein [Phormidium sp. FACHB-592]